MKYLFNWIEDKERGTYGWAPAHNPLFEPGFGGLLLAHDIFEHFWKDDYGDANHEIAAFGAAVYCRPEDLYDDADAFARSYVDILSQIDEYSRVKLQRGSTGFLVWNLKTRPLYNDYHERVISLWASKVQDLLKAGYYDSEEPIDSGWQAVYPQLIHWARWGYLQAQQRYRHVYQEDIQHAWLKVRDEGDRLGRQSDFTTPYGQDLEVSIVFKHPELVTLKLLELSDDPYR